MFGPALPARMKQRNQVPGHWVASGRPIVFMIVAPLAGPGEVLQLGTPPTAARFNVLGGERLHCEAILASAIFAATAGTLGHLPP